MRILRYLFELYINGLPQLIIRNSAYISKRVIFDAFRHLTSRDIRTPLRSQTPTL